MGNSDPALRRFTPATGYLVLLAALAAGALMFYPRFSLNHDSSWFLVATRKWLDGQALYVDILETNPPMGFFLTAPALWLAEWTGLRPATAFAIYLVALATGSGVWVLRLVRRSQLDGTRQAVLIVGALVGLFLFPLHEFGQREHFMLVLAMPYFVHLALGAEYSPASSRERVTLGLAAMLGLALKPYFILIPAGLLLAGPTTGLLRRGFDVANLSVTAGLIIFVAITVIGYPAYLVNVVAPALQVYGSYGKAPVGVIVRPELFALLGGLALVALFARRQGQAAFDDLSVRLIGAACGALLTFLVQFKGWNYQVLPFAFFLFLATIWLFVASGAFARRDLPAGILAIAVVSLTLGNQFLTGPYRAATTAAFAPYIERQGMSVLVLSTNVWASFPFINETDSRWASRYPAQWPIPGAIVGLSRTDCRRDAARCADFRRILTDARQTTVADMARNRPDVVFIDDRQSKSYFWGQPFDYLAFLSIDPAFVQMWAQYRKVGETPGFEVWRRDASSFQR